MIWRYRQVGPGDTTALQSWISAPLGPQFKSSFTFQKGIGLIRNTYNSGSIDASASNEHYLISSTITAVTLRPSSSMPSSVCLYQNFPNPFNPSTAIRFVVPATGHVTLQVYDILGREVTRVVDRVMQSGDHTVFWEASNLASGLYIYRLQAGPSVFSKKMLFIK